MTASSADTAELPVTGPTVVTTTSRALPAGGPVIEPPVGEPRIEPRFVPAAGPEAPAPPVDPPVRAVGPEVTSGPGAPSVGRAPTAPSARPACRAELRAQRLQARRVRRRYAFLGLSLLAGTLGATVLVLDTLH